MTSIFKWLWKRYQTYTKKEPAKRKRTILILKKKSIGKSEKQWTYYHHTGQRRDNRYYGQTILQKANARNAIRQTDICRIKRKRGQQKKQIKHPTKQYQHESTKKKIDYFQNFAPRTSNLYGLPKMHKSQEIKSAIDKQRSTYIKVLPPTNLPFIPIVAGPTCPTHRLSNFVDIILNPFASTYRATSVIIWTSLTTPQMKLKKPPY